jgi:hypothetical protein
MSATRWRWYRHSVVAARNAAERIGVEYRILTAVTEAVAATAPGAPQLYEDVSANLCCDSVAGDAAATDAAFTKAHHIAKIDLVNNRLVPNAMESRAALAEFEPAIGDYTLYTSTQLPHLALVLIGVLILGIPERKLRVVAPDVGGGLGSKQVVYAEEGLVTWAARKLERPVKWVADRSEAFLSDAQGRDHVTHAELALDRDGKFLGLRVSTQTNIGGYVLTFGPNIPTNLYGPLLAGVYTTPAIYCEVKVVFTNTVPTDAYRGAGRPEATYVLELLVDVAARGSAPDEPFMEGWTALSGLAASTSRIRLATLATSVGYRNPAHLAKIPAGVDLISRGPPTLGIGAGYLEDRVPPIWLGVPGAPGGAYPADGGGRPSHPGAPDVPQTLCGNAARSARHSHSSREAKRWRRAIRSNLAHPDAAAKSP